MPTIRTVNGSVVNAIGSNWVESQFATSKRILSGLIELFLRRRVSQTVVMTSSQASAAQKYRQLIAECQKLTTKISELEMDRNEHRLVEETLRPLDGKRRAYRLVGEVLVERSVADVLPSVTSNRENVRSFVAACTYHCLYGMI